MENTQTQSAALVVKRTMPFAPDVLFRAFTDPKEMSRWFFADKGWTCDAGNDFQVGGAFHVAMRKDKDTVVRHEGIYKEIVPGEKLVFTWNSPFAHDSVVTLLFSKVKDGTEMTLTHEFLAAEQRENHNRGWNGCLDNLQGYLRSAGD
jgi:uncharacterized protein YndB with AHSA1/START domain